MRTKKHWGRKGFALFLALLLALSPAAAFAESTDVADESQQTQVVEETKAPEPETKAETQKPETKPEVTETKAPENDVEKPAEETKPDPAPSQSASDDVKQPSASDKQEEPEQKAETCIITFNVNHPEAGTITADGSAVNAAAYQKKLEKGKAFPFTVVPDKDWEIDSIKADGRDVEKAGEHGYILSAVEKDTEIAVQYQKAKAEEPEKKPEADDAQKDADHQAVPTVVQTFLDAVAQIPEIITQDNMEEAAELLYGACADAYEELLGTEYEERDDVQKAVKVYEAAVKKIERLGDYTSDAYDSSLEKSAFAYAQNLGQSDTVTGIITLDGEPVTDSGVLNVWATGSWGGPVNGHK